MQPLQNYPSTSRLFSALSRFLFLPPILRGIPALKGPPPTWFIVVTNAHYISAGLVLAAILIFSIGVSVGMYIVVRRRAITYEDDPQDYPRIEDPGTGGFSIRRSFLAKGESLEPQSVMPMTRSWATSHDESRSRHLCSCLADAQPAWRLQPAAPVCLCPLVSDVGHTGPFSGI